MIDMSEEVKTVEITVTPKIKRAAVLCIEALETLQGDAEGEFGDDIARMIKLLRKDILGDGTEEDLGEALNQRQKSLDDGLS